MCRSILICFVAVAYHFFVFVFRPLWSVVIKAAPGVRGTKRLVSVNICSVEGNSADIFVSKVPPGIFAIKVK